MHLDEIREETMIFEETYNGYVDKKVSRFDKEDRQVGKSSFSIAAGMLYTMLI